MDADEAQFWLALIGAATLRQTPTAKLTWSLTATGTTRIHVHFSYFPDHIL